MKRRLTPSRLRRVFNLWPPFLFAGIRVERISDDWRRARVRLRLRWFETEITAPDGSVSARVRKQRLIRQKRGQPPLRLAGPPRSGRRRPA